MKIFGFALSFRAQNSCERRNIDALRPTSSTVILSGAPRESTHHRAQGRGVEGSPQCVELRCGIEAFSRQTSELLNARYALAGRDEAHTARLMWHKHSCLCQSVHLEKASTGKSACAT